jgi:hypothetical protein
MRRLLVIALLSAVAGPLRADIYECEEPGGTKRFTNIKADAKGCKALVVSPVVVSPPPVPSTRTTAPRSTDAVRSPEGFPKVVPQVQQQRDQDRRKILEAELINEEKMLEDARRELAEQENTRLGSERNAQRMIDRIEPYQRNVKLHEDNVVNLRRELSNLR